MAKLFSSPALQEENLTVLEERTISSIIEGLYSEPHNSDLAARDVSKDTGITMRSLRGILASLTNKGYITIKENPAGFPVIYLSIDHWNLHPEWSNSNEYHNYMQSKGLAKC